MDWAIITGVGAGVVVAVGGIVTGYLSTGARMVKRLDELTTRVFHLQDELGKCKADHHESFQREQDLKTDLGAAQRRISVLETATGIGHTSSVPGVVIANLQGIIQEFSPSLTVLLGWLPKEMWGQPITKMVPPELRDKHSMAFQAAAVGESVMDPARHINTYALDKNGRRTPVSITVRKWPGPAALITATIMLRPSATDNGDEES